MKNEQIKSEEKREDIRKMIDELWNQMEGKTKRIFEEQNANEESNNSQQKQRIL